ncbi:hypothetical protein LZ30DRAFT_474510 [Colletotrichum cereale]|nr:hypothetical protein LZ30DRAFT_474510 [Colletotrichum cereale]
MRDVDGLRQVPLQDRGRIPRHLLQLVALPKFSKDASSSLVSVESRRGRSLAQLSSDITAQKNLRFTPWGEPLYFWYQGHRLTLRCTQDQSNIVSSQHYDSFVRWTIFTDSNEKALRLADQFAAQVPDLEFSPADIFSS